MKIPKTTKRFCPYCRKKTEQKIKLVSTGAKRGTLRRGSLARAKLRGSNTGIGNKGTKRIATSASGLAFFRATDVVLSLNA